MNVCWMKVHPIAFIEYKFDEDGNKRASGPFCESEEAEESEKWTVSSSFLYAIPCA
jgi:hypothetical protein